MKGSFCFFLTQQVESITFFSVVVSRVIEVGCLGTPSVSGAIHRILFILSIAVRSLVLHVVVGAGAVKQAEAVAQALDSRNCNHHIIIVSSFTPFYMQQQKAH